MNLRGQGLGRSQSELDFWAGPRARSGLATTQILYPFSFPLQSLHGKEWPRENLEGRPRHLSGQLLGPPEVKR